MNIYCKLIFVLLSLFPLSLCSNGDRSPFYQNCVKKCEKANCTSDGAFLPKAAEAQDIWCRLFYWGCKDECRYNCMWRTVEGFKERGIEIPKFHGKWPFKRILGMQEPASAFASFLNLVVNIYMYTEMYHGLPEKRIPVLVPFWHIFAFVNMNAWLWSTIFHTRDVFFTEFMDYASALSVVLAIFLSSIVRMFYKWKMLTKFLVITLVMFYSDYVRVLYWGKMDYESNMQINLFFGFAGFFLWIFWSAQKAVYEKNYVWRLYIFLLWTAMASSLELYDFPPIHGWDSHALWHLATVPLPILLYRFIVDDIKELVKEDEKKD